MKTRFLFQLTENYLNIKCLIHFKSLLSPHLDIGDHRIEVIGLENCLHMGQVRTGLKASARRLGTLFTYRNG